MVDKIFELKGKALERMEQSIKDRGVERMDVAEMEKLADIVKDLSEAEKSCWEAEYYRSVTEAMEQGQGYDGGREGGMGYGGEGGMGYGGLQGNRSGYRGRRGYSRRGYGYHGDVQNIRQMLDGASPDEREQLKREIRQMLD